MEEIGDGRASSTAKAAKEEGDQNAEKETAGHDEAKRRAQIQGRLKIWE